MTGPVRVFLSYSRADQVIARDVLTALRRLGHAVWFDEDGVRTGASARRTILGALQLQPVVLFLASGSSVTRPWVRSELSFAIHAGSPIVVLRVQPVGLPVWLRPRRVISLGRSLDGAIEQVSAEIHRGWSAHSSSMP